MILDTGASYNCIGINKVKELKKEKTIRKNIHDITFISASGNEMKVVGTLELEIKIERDPSEYRISFKVVKEVENELNLGEEFLQATEAKIDFKEGVYTLNNQEYEMNLEESKIATDEILSNKAKTFKMTEENIREKFKTMIENQKRINPKLWEKLTM